MRSASTTFVQACKDIQLLTHRGHATFRDDLAVRYALERLLEIVGEASSALSEECRAATPAVPWRDITRMRVLLAHHYHRTDPEQVWSIATVEIPELLKQLDTR
jgi:uncharacterized protein with HEPN domain